MGRRDRGQDHIDLQRQAEKKKRAAHKRHQQQVTKQLQSKINDEKATVESLESELQKLDAFRALTVQQKSLKESLIEKLEAAKELEKMKKVFEEERNARHARGEYSGDDDDLSSGFDDDDDDNDVGPRAPPQPDGEGQTKIESIDEDDPWAQVFALQEQEEAEKNKTKKQSTANLVTTSSSNHHHRQQNIDNFFVPISAMTSSTTKLKNTSSQQETDAKSKTKEDAEAEAFLASLDDEDEE